MTPSSFVVLRRGDSGPAVAAVCERLVLSGDLPGGPGHTDRYGEPIFDERVEAAVKSFQQRRGLLVDGIVGPSTFTFLF